ncbi:hypothetical protein D3C72_2574640 [compost metagenome]
MRARNRQRGLDGASGQRVRGQVRLGKIAEIILRVEDQQMNGARHDVVDKVEFGI